MDRYRPPNKEERVHVGQLRVLVTGANSGIGLGLVRAYTARGDHVFATCRRSSSELDVTGATVVEGIEMSSAEAIGRLPEIVGAAGLDVLICNAAVVEDSAGLEDIDVDILAHSFDVNALGPVRLVLALLPRLNSHAKIMLVAIGAQALNNLVVPTHSRGNYGYRMSKAALTAFGGGLARDVRARGISVVISAPGFADTPQVRRVFAQGKTSREVMDNARDPDDVGRLFQARIDELTLENSPAWQAQPEGDPVLLPLAPGRH
jgi:NAD(P)-dependent dehydrogenase (short-subunit alcohol dehydrogenase family)